MAAVLEAEKLGAAPAGARRLELVLVGGGHAHLQVLRRWMMRPAPGVRLSLVLDRAEAVYSGMLPGFVAGDYGAREIEVDCVPLARRAGARVILAAATGLDIERRLLHLEGRPPLFFDIASFDVGSVLRGAELPGVREHALATRPLHQFARRLPALIALARARAQERGGPLRAAVVGAGAAGVELAFTLQHRLRAEVGEGAVEVTVLGDSGGVLPGASRALARRASREARRRGIRLRGGCTAVALEAERAVQPPASQLCAQPVALAVLLEGGERVDCDLAVWATGAAPPPLLAALPLPRDARGFLRVSETLQSPACGNIFAAGDCAALDSAPDLPKAGVYAVRAGPVLETNLRRRLHALRAAQDSALRAAPRLRRFRPQRDFLSLLNLGGGRVLGGKWGMAASGRALWRLKDRIDRRFVRRFRVLNAGGGDARGFPPPERMGMAQMACGGCAAKLSAGALAEALARLPAPAADPAVLLGLRTPDDAAAFSLAGSGALLATLDGFRAFTDDDWLVGRVAAQNAMNDIAACGGSPRFALAWVCVPEDAGGEALYQVLAGLRRELDAQGVSLLGGHSSTGPELSVGLAVLGALPRDAAPLLKSALRAGDRLVLTRALGSGVVLAADMQGRAAGAWLAAAHAAMLRSNARAAALAREHGVCAATDVSGFGLAGHLGEMLCSSGLAARLFAPQLPALPGVRALLALGLRSTFHAQNEPRARAMCSGDASALDLALLCDPQTSGGLLLGVSAARSAALVQALRAAGDSDAVEIGEALPHSAAQPRIRIEGAGQVRRG
ncbi:MAG: selenide, water dikinase SelD [Deltaproteobacteria bacterium]|nr:selenide, water dikinase SelD [Deltaproteobacteria bacterium]